MKIESLPMSPAKPTVARKRWRTPVIGLVVVALAGGGWTVMQKGKGDGAKPGAQAAGDKKGPPAVEVYELAKADVAAIEARELRVKLPLSGSLTPVQQATVKSKVSGVVLETTVQEGMSVRQGQVMARLDASDLKARMAQQQAALEEAQARLSLATKNNTNNQALLKQNYISRNAFDTTQNSVELARASVRAMQAQLELARNAVADTVIRAPLSGVISKRHVQAGEKVAPDMSVFTVVSLATLTLEAQVPASDIPRIKAGQEVQFKVDGYQERSFSGKVERINPTTEGGSRAIPVYIAVANGDGALRGGMFAKGSITTAKSAAMPLVPLAALRDEKGVQVVYQVVDGKVLVRPVKLGLRNEDEGYAEVTEGLGAGSTVLVAKLEGVKPGNKVKLAGVPAAAPATAAAPAPARKG